jgi:hypothetical protein
MLLAAGLGVTPCPHQQHGHQQHAALAGQLRAAGVLILASCRSSSRALEPSSRAVAQQLKQQHQEAMCVQCRQLTSGKTQHPCSVCSRTAAQCQNLPSRRSLPGLTLVQRHCQGRSRLSTLRTCLIQCLRTPHISSKCHIFMSQKQALNQQLACTTQATTITSSSSTFCPQCLMTEPHLGVSCSPHLMHR